MIRLDFTKQNLYLLAIAHRSTLWRSMISSAITTIKRHLLSNYSLKFASEWNDDWESEEIHFRLSRKSDRHQKASECYRKSLKLNPFLWSSFEALCRLGKSSETPRRRFSEKKNTSSSWFHLRLGERVDTSIFCSSAVKSNRSSSELSQPNICVTPYAEQIKDIQSENQAIDNVRIVAGVDSRIDLTGFSF